MLKESLKYELLKTLLESLVTIIWSGNIYPVPYIDSKLWYEFQELEYGGMAPSLAAESWNYCNYCTGINYNPIDIITNAKLSFLLLRVEPII